MYQRHEEYLNPCSRSMKLNFAVLIYENLFFLDHQNKCEQFHLNIEKQFSSRAMHFYHLLICICSSLLHFQACFGSLFSQRDFITFFLVLVFDRHQMALHQLSKKQGKVALFFLFILISIRVLSFTHCSKSQFLSKNST